MALPQLCDDQRQFEDLQDGYRVNAVTQTSLINEPISKRATGQSWQDSWYVIAVNYFADPFIIDITETTLAIYFAYHGQGNWELEKIAHSFAEFKNFLLKISTLYQSESNINQIVQVISEHPYKDTEFWQEVLETVHHSKDETQTHNDHLPIDFEQVKIKGQIHQLYNQLNQLNEDRNEKKVDLKPFYQVKKEINEQIKSLSLLVK